MKPENSDQNQNDEPQEDEADQEVALGQRFLIFNVMPSWLVSFIVHVVLIIILAVAYWTIPTRPTVGLETGEAVEDMAAMDNINFDSTEDSSDTLEENTEVEESNQDELSEAVEQMDVETDVVDTAVSDLLSDAMMESTNAEANASVGALAGAAEKVSGRSGRSRQALVAKNGGSAASENAVKMAMEWIAKHQLKDGSWNFDHRAGPNAPARASPNPGDFTKSPNAATAMSLLVFLGAGQTHVEGDYKDVVEKGLAFLLRNGEKIRLDMGSGTAFGLSFYERDGGLYNHGLAAIALFEAYAMTDDPRFALACQQTLNYIEYCQDPVGGGWRYEPQQAGDTSAVGWQIMALKSALMCGLDVDPVVVRKARRFLNFTSTESGAFYGYKGPEEGERSKGLASVGLLSQMYLGWDKEHQGLRMGANWLSDRGPDIGDWKPNQTNLSEAEKSKFKCGMYYNYYATQVMHQFDGPDGSKWKKWNEEMRDFLIATQASEGPAKGSWFFSNAKEGGYIHGGRLYATTMAAMNLEVYYRYLPLYDEKKTAEAEFDLD